MIDFASIRKIQFLKIQYEIFAICDAQNSKHGFELLFCYNRTVNQIEINNGDNWKQWFRTEQKNKSFRNLLLFFFVRKRTKPAMKISLWAAFLH